MKYVCSCLLIYFMLGEHLLIIYLLIIFPCHCRIQWGGQERPFGIQILLFSCSFWQKNRLAHLLWELVRPSGKPWIRHCLHLNPFCNFSSWLLLFLLYHRSNLFRVHFHSIQHHDNLVLCKVKLRNAGTKTSGSGHRRERNCAEDSNVSNTF